MVSQVDLEKEVDRLRTEVAALREKEHSPSAYQIWSEAFNSTSEAIVIYDADGLLVACNQSFRDLYNYSEAEACPGVHFAELGRIDVERGNVVIGDEFGGGEEYLRRKADYREKLEGSFIIRLKDGRWIKTIDRPVTQGGFVSMQVDVTEMKRTEEELRKAKEAAELAAQSKSEFLANVSHDLRTPLNAIIGFSEMMLNEIVGTLENDKHREYLGNIHRSGSLLLSIVDDILDTAKLDSGKYVIKFQHFDLNECCDEVIKDFSPFAFERDLALSYRLAPELPETVFLDRRALVQVLNKLVSNACKHTPAGGKVRIEWSLPDPGTIAFSVVDDGVGVSQDLIERLGEPFLSEGRAEATSGQRGTGLGLYICGKLTEAMGGTMQFKSQLGKGTTVSVTLPMPDQESPERD